MARDRLIYVVSDVHDTPEHAAVLRDANAPLAGQVVCNAQVGSRSLASLGRMVGHAIDKRFEMTGAPKNAQRLWDWMSACLIAGGTNLLVVNRAQNLDPKLWLDLFEFAAISNCDLVLVTQSRSRSQREIIRAWPIQEVPWEFLAARIAVVSADPEPTAVPEARPVLVGTDVPIGVDFPHFLRAAARVLAPRDYESVAEVWRDACTEAMQLVDDKTSREDILRLALTNLDRAATVIEAGVRIRGCQFGLFLRGYLLWVDDVRFATALEHGRLSPLDATTARQVMKYPCTQRAALAVLTLALDPTHEELVKLEMADIQFQGDTVSIAGTRLQIPEEATLAVRSHHIVRLAEGASAGDRFFESRDGTWASTVAAVRALQHALRAAERDTGLRMTRHHTSGRHVGVKNQARISGLRLTCLTHDNSTAATQ